MELEYRPFYGREIEHYRRTDRGGSGNLAHRTKFKEHFDLNDDLSNGASPSSDTDNKPRKRVPVACGRCRKRKIKCSGDEGNGLGCSNCSNSGTREPCQFLRVSSEECDVSKLGPSTRIWQLGHRLNPYIRNGNFTFPQSCTSSTNYHGLQHGYDFNTYNAAVHGNGWTRGHQGSAYGYTYEEDSPVQCSSHFPAYLYPNADSTNNLTPYLASPTSPRAWGPVTQMSRGNHSTYSENLVTPSTASAGGQFAPYSHGPPGMSNEPIFVNTVNTSNIIGTSDRLLPDPTTSRSFSATKITSIESTPMNLIQRSPWGEPLSSSNAHSSNRTFSIGLSDCSDASVRSAASSGHHQDMGFGFMSNSHSPQDGSIHHNGSAPAAAVTAAESNQSAQFEYQKPVLVDYNKDRCRTLSRDSLHDENAAGEAYGYSSENRAACRPIEYSSYSGRLSNGQEYTRLKQSSNTHAHSSVAVAPEEFRQESAAHQTHLPHRASIASINNPSGY